MFQQKQLPSWAQSLLHFLQRLHWVVTTAQPKCVHHGVERSRGDPLHLSQCRSKSRLVFSLWVSFVVCAQILNVSLRRNKLVLESTTSMHIINPPTSF
jgi:hypothetical protein